MRIVLCSSVYFYDHAWKIKRELEELGHEVLIPTSMGQKWDQSYKEKVMKKDYEKYLDMKKSFLFDHFDRIHNADAILVINDIKNGEKNYIGGGTLVEMSIAFAEEKKIYMMNEIPEIKYFKDEIEAMRPIIINGDLRKIR